MRMHGLIALSLFFLAAACAPASDRPPQTQRTEALGATQSRLLEAHNEWRREVGATPLQWSTKLEDYAQEWADTLQSRGCTPEHREIDQYGENIAWASGVRLPPERVVAMWGEEKEFYDYESNSCVEGEICGHYTQVVWEDTRRVGCAVARCEKSEVWVCNYDPPGNWVGEKPY